ncbi:IS66-like element accessory protein TnpA [Rhizobium hidalgonense]|uniref:IS66-like element accessory protein TnpA n=1 Tax=Rhizobium hidalgonense TaxID=1538159 RepID=UPI001FDF7A4C|nr:transposase [Rhizobium hidalgonense]
MTLDILTGSGDLRALKVLSNGKRRFDPVEKERLIDAAMKPGVSVARLALAHGVNANQLRNWVKLRRNRQAQDALTVVARGQETSAFVPLLPTARHPDMPARPSSAGMRLIASLPNGVRLELADVDERALSAMVEVLGRCNVPAG